MSSTSPTVAVIGTGTVGAMALWQLAKRGVSAVGFDAYAPGHDRGGYGGQTRIFRIAYREGAEYVPLLRRSLAGWRTLESETDSSLFTPTGGLTIAPEGHPDLDMVRNCAADFDLAHEELSPAQSMKRFPHLPIEADEKVFIDHTAGVLRPEKAIIAAATQAESLGATVHRYCPVQAIEAADHGVLLRTARGEHRFDRVVLAPGPWITDLAEFPALQLEVHQITTLWYQQCRPGEFRPERTPVVLRNGPIAYSSFPAVDGDTVKVSLHSLPRPRVPSAEHVTRNPAPELLAAMREAVTRFLPDVYPDPVRIGSYADSFTPDGHPVIGQLPGLPNVTVLTGFSGHGFKMAPVFGEIAADLAVDGTTGHNVTHLGLARYVSPPTLQR
ncbi:MULTISPECIES: N-methyl-L-tryptophan oxidase [Actinopolyspora]|uniref:N-methyl-L-tryptophan oxidase n=1 Tax=Actinopolyspora TaxID=1849 RepID=UPI00035E97EF|nr:MULTISPECIES: N-methyl-L-tryptophan oxidase [Actinopolyspora]NHD17765.1 N-methyl-L-tryptophan oxidase [Actinopolyspora sp. BKK2]NHE76502.1 N-methyl-L-tryptophan oxidase [Actinopolyspora sp. BKK1]